MPAFRPVEERLSERLDRSGDCWTWTGAIAPTGYGRIGIGGTLVAQVHRVAYELWVGEIPEGFHIDHLCRNRACCNPSHLEAVTQRENNRRAAAVRAATPRQCKRGHDLSGGNLFYHSRGGRQCRECHRFAGRARRRGVSVEEYLSVTTGADFVAFLSGSRTDSTSSAAISRPETEK